MFQVGAVRAKISTAIPMGIYGIPHATLWLSNPRRTEVESIAVDNSIDSALDLKFYLE